jgi:hypothetical protein
MQRGIARTCTAANVLLLLTAVLGAAQSPAPATAASSLAAEKKYSGCVQGQPGENSMLVLSGDGLCARLTGKFPAESITGHEIELRGTLTPRTPQVTAFIAVTSILTVGKTCANSCSLYPLPAYVPGKGDANSGKQPDSPPAAPPPPATPPARPPQQ